MVQMSFGASKKSIFMHHISRNVLIPVVTQIGLALPMLVTGAIITESIFGWPGVGPYLMSATKSLDYPVIMAVMLLSATLVILGNLLSDILYRLVDPRIKQGGSLMNWSQRFRLNLRKYPSYGIALLFLFVIFMLALLIPFVPIDPNATDVSNISALPSRAHWFGTDELGRDYLIRVIYGSRISLLVGVLAMLTSTIIGTGIGLLSAIMVVEWIVFNAYG